MQDITERLSQTTPEHKKSAELFVFSRTSNLTSVILCQASFNFAAKLFNFVITEIAILQQLQCRAPVIRPTYLQLL